MTIDDPQPVADPEPTLLVLTATRPGLGVAELPDLESRITTRRAVIIAKLVEIKAESTSEAAEMRSTIKARLSELGHILKEGLVDGWANLGDVAKQKLEQWLAR